METCFFIPSWQLCLEGTNRSVHWPATPVLGYFVESRVAECQTVERQNVEYWDNDKMSNNTLTNPYLYGWTYRLGSRFRQLESFYSMSCWHFSVRHDVFRHFLIWHYVVRHFRILHYVVRHFGIWHYVIRHFGIRHCNIATAETHCSLRLDLLRVLFFGEENTSSPFLPYPIFITTFYETENWKRASKFTYSVRTNKNRAIFSDAGVYIHCF
jgi:hypothetical protein